MMTGLICLKCGSEATYNQAQCWDNGHTEDGVKLEESDIDDKFINCDHKFVEKK